MEPITKERLISMFLLDGPPYLVSYQYRKKISGYKEHLPLLKKMIREKLVTVVQKTNKTILYQYHPGKTDTLYQISKQVPA